MSEGFYVASRASIPERGKMWREWRSSGVPVISSWIDEDGEGQTESFSELWIRIASEVRRSWGLVLYVDEGDLPLKGALVEVGIALGSGVAVHIVCPGYTSAKDGSRPRPLGSWVAHPLVRWHDSLESVYGPEVTR